jgi:hypothetical protein
MSSVDFRVIAQAVLETQLKAFPNIDQKLLVDGLQDNYQMRLFTNPRDFDRTIRYDYDKFSDKQREFLNSISDALKDLRIERFGPYDP